MKDEAKITEPHTRLCSRLPWLPTTLRAYLRYLGTYPPTLPPYLLTYHTLLSLRSLEY